ncbi:SDR family oxidoreductase [Edwardsiella piscicida]|uniref:SDR family NAD(P)-dependent oxidoreductase n=1 Tax=Edwardsiella piscicida TaxID=1263550 RepID=UPI0002C09077|nr:SDR family oxidoreductase [Edwardsiella piscicida]AGH73053.1 short-chain dehydrogenase/reductase SDR [Edwardsiella piscicida C07-087]EKS7778739.1 SDR family oxidoreductase [Edwardsiella piscicida]EKS7782159.1 SDR family oxidoreductase [Edwardsiella piscicida]ELM3722567.1 SDR family oxidoreductase [Edwardsiella piscicida]UCQ25329.1 SDR family oxidoreductase [Edwardsiella piscicida]
MSRFAGKVAIVSGGAQGIGKAIVCGLLQEGAEAVVIADWQPEALADAQATLGERVLAVPTDVSRQRDVAQLIALTLERYGHIDMLFNNAGICRYNLFLEESEQSWETTFNVNVKGMFLLGQAVARAMVERGTRGAIVNTASIACELVSPTTAAYAASKGAVMQLTRVMALELAQHGIRVNAFGPGATRTDMTAQSRANPQRRAMFMSKLVDQRYGEPDEIAAVALFLASDEASFINGACYYVDGGYRVQ